jgi:hypothetical protein
MLGRWICRDPEEESGGINLYGFVSNEPINHWDYLGWDSQSDEDDSRSGGGAFGGGGGGFDTTFVSGYDGGLGSGYDDMNSLDAVGLDSSSSAAATANAIAASITATVNSDVANSPNTQVNSSLAAAVNGLSGGGDTSTVTAPTGATDIASLPAVSSPTSPSGDPTTPAEGGSLAPVIVGGGGVPATNDSGVVYGAYGGASGVGATYAPGAPPVQMARFVTTGKRLIYGNGFTVVFGTTAGGGLGFGATVNPAQYAISYSIHNGFQHAILTGGSINIHVLPTASAGGFVQLLNAGSVQQLAGKGFFAGGSAGEGLVGGIDGVLGAGYGGVQFTIGVGGGTPIEAHYGVGQTVIVGSWPAGPNP